MTNRRNFLMAFLAIVTLPALPALAADPATSTPPDRPMARMSEEERARLEQMSPEDRRAYMRENMQRPGAGDRPGVGDRPGAGDRDSRRERMEERLTPEQREKLKSMSPQERREFVQNMRQRQGVDGNRNGVPDRMEDRLSDEQKAKLKNMSPEERREFFKGRRDNRMDRDNNPPGRAGGPGTNWENPPGREGGPGASPDPVERHLTPEERARLEKMSPEQRQEYMKEMRGKYRDRLDRDNNPPGAAGGAGTNWENRPGPQDGPGTSPDYPRYDRDNNPPGATGGAGTNWENRPGPQGGPGASPDRRSQRNQRPQRDRNSR